VVEGLVTSPEMRSRLRDDVRAALRPVPDFPVPGVLFQDITPVLGEAGLFGRVVAALAEPWAGATVTHVAAVESRGFMLGGAVAAALGVGFVPIRKPGRLPRTAARVAYALEYREDVLEMHVDACPGGRVLVLDDVLATGGTAAAACTLVEEVGAQVVGAAFLLCIEALAGAARLPGRRVESLLTC
jgi:adenine phosphoribosyltransferase